MEKIFKLLIIFPFFLLIPSCAQPQTFEDYKHDFTDDFKTELGENHVSNAVFAVIDRNNTILSESYSGNSSDTDANTPFLIGSVTKVFTAVAIMRLYQQGKIDIDHPITEYIPDFAIRQRFPESAPITIRSVLTHHAGLPSDIYAHKFSTKPDDFNVVLPYLNGQFTCFPVGKIRTYSNLGYALLGILVERVSGQKYADYISENIFKPLGMNASGFYTDYDAQKSLSMAYDQEGNKKAELPLIDQPAGGIYSTLNDMILFCRSFIDGKETLLNVAHLERMFSLQNKENLLDLDHRSAICFNFKNKAYELGRVFEHGGATMFHRAQMVIAPDAGLAGIVLSDSPNGKDNSWKLDELFMVEFCKAKQISPDKTLNVDKNKLFTPISSKDLESYAGNYAMPGMVCRFDWKHDHLSPTINQEQFYLVQQDSNAFVPAKRFLGMMFKSKKMYFLLEEIDGEKQFIQAMPWGGLSIIGTQTKPGKIPDIWKKRTGKYKISRINTDDVATLENVQLTEESGFFVLKYSFSSEMSFGQDATLALDIKNDQEAFVIGYGRGGGESVIFDPTGQNFNYLGLRFTRI